MRRYEFFYGVMGDDVSTLLEKYKYWNVVAFGSDVNGFWMLLKTRKD